MTGMLRIQHNSRFQTLFIWTEDVLSGKLCEAFLMPFLLHILICPFLTPKIRNLSTVSEQRAALVQLLSDKTGNTRGLQERVGVEGFCMFERLIG